MKNNSFAGRYCSLFSVPNSISTDSDTFFTIPHPTTSTQQITIDVNHCENDLTKLLPPALFLKQTPNNAVGLHYLSGSDVTIVASKNTNRYRLQADTLPAIGVTLEWLLSRLRRYYGGESQPFSASFSPPLPLSEYFEVIERHYKVHIQCR